MFSPEFTTDVAIADLVMHTTTYDELAETDPAFAADYWHSIRAMYLRLDFEPEEFTYMTWLVDEMLKRFNTEIEDLLYAGQEN